MKIFDKKSWDNGKCNPKFGKPQNWIFPLLLLFLFWANPVQADLIISSINQTPQNNVPVGTSVTYQVNVTYPGGFGGGEFAAIRILNNSLDVSQLFSSQECTLDGRFFCTTVSDTAVYRFTWTPPSTGTQNLIFDLTCSPTCSGERQGISTVVVNPQPPVANAGPDQIVIDTDNSGAESITLDGSGSSDPDNDIASYEWFITDLSLGTGENLAVNLPVGNTTITLVVTDQLGNTDQDTVVITVNAGPQPPTANAGLDQTVTDTDNSGAETITLDGSGSSDPDNDIASYEWFDGSQSLGTGVNLAVNLPVGNTTITLVVTDQVGNSDQDTVVITVNAGPQAPTANAGPDQTVTDTDNSGTESVTLDGSGSTDPDNDIVSYEWFITDLSLGTGENLAVNLPVGNTTITLVVTDQLGNSDQDTVVITVNAGPQAPTANAGPDQIVTDTDNSGAETITLDGSSSIDPDNDIASYEWFDGSQSLGTGVNLNVDLSVGTNTITLVVTDQLGNSDQDTVVITVNAGLQAPTANAGADQNVIDTDNSGTESVTLDGSGSTDPDNDIASYEWFDTDLSLGTGVNLAVDLAVGINTITLVVTDQVGNTDQDTVVITVNAGPQAPTANAGPDQTVIDTDNSGAETITLDGSGSSDPDNDIASYEWFDGSQSLGTGVNLNVDLSVGTNTITLVVTDQLGNSDQDTVVITVNAGQQAPTANAGPDQTVSDTDNSGSETITLDGSGSSDPDNDIASYEWFIPDLSLGTGVNLAVNLPVGTNTITLVVTDQVGNIDQDTVVITVTAGTQAPTANAGPDQNVIDSNNDGIESIMLDGSGSSDPDNDIVSYEWFDGQLSLGTGQTLGVNLAVGTTTITLRVTDQVGNTDQDTVVITINAGSQAPTANAGPDQNIVDTNNDGVESVTLDGSGSSDPDNDIASYEWFEGSQFLGAGVNLTIDLAVGTYTLTLVVMDQQENISTDDVDITIQESEITTEGDTSIETLSGENQRLSVGESSEPLSIRVVGPNGQPLPGVVVTWEITPADAADVTTDTTTTNAQGESSNRVIPTANRPPGSTFKVSASVPGGVSARFQVNPISGISGLNQAQRSVAGALDNACPAIQSLSGQLTPQQQSLLDTCDFLATASDQDITSALQQFVPSEIAAQGRNSISLAGVRNKNIQLRLDYLRGGLTGPSLENLTVAIQGEQLPSILISELTGIKRGGGASADDSNLVSRLGVFANGNITIGDTETTEREAGFDFDTNGLTLGVDYRYTDQFVFGGALNYISTDSDFDSQSSSLDIDGYSLSLYGTYYESEQMFVDGILSIGLNDYDSAREFQTAGVNHDLTGDTEGTEYALSIGAGYEFHHQNLTFIPQGRINYLNVEVDSYDEMSSGSGLSLNIGDQDIESLVATVSGSVSLAYSTQYGVFIPYASIEWEREFKNDSRAITARFLSDPSNTNFSVLTNNPDRDYFNLGLGLTATLKKGKSAFVYYETLLGHKDTKQYSLTGGFRLEF